MKKLIVFILVSISFLFTFDIYAGNCGYNAGSNIKGSLNSCLSDTTLVKPGSDLDTSKQEFNDKIYNIVKTIATILSLGAVLGIVYGSFIMVTSTGEDEKIKKAKDIIKWSIVGFLGVVLASGIIALVVNFLYDLK